MKKKTQRDIRVDPIMKKLTPEEKTVVAQFMYDFDKPRVAKALGMTRAKVDKILARPHVKFATSKVATDTIKRVELKKEDLIRELYFMATRDVVDLSDENGQIIVDNLRALPERIRKCIDGIKIRKRTFVIDGEEQVETQYEVKLTPKLAAVELAMKYLKMLTDQIETTHTHTLNWDAMVSPPAVTPHLFLQERVKNPEATDEELFKTLFPTYNIAEDFEGGDDEAPK